MPTLQQRRFSRCGASFTSFIASIHTQEEDLHAKIKDRKMHHRTYRDFVWV
jgi:hypothetical protein